jgi:transcriptional regulator with XRE-family HTH domain
MSINSEISEVLIRVGRNVRKYRIEKGLTQQELGFLAGNIERGTICNIERFSANGVNLSTLIKISVVLEVDIKELFR